jgi:hypothetical protein
MDKFDVDRPTIDYLHRQYKKGRIDIRPEYQRNRVWNDEQRYALIDSITEEFPIGLVMLNVVPHVDEDGVKVDHYEVVDGQQRMSTVFEYLDGAQWALSSRIEDFQPFSKLSEASQTRFQEYKVPVALMKDFDQEEIRECYNRLQRGKPLKIGEKLKSVPMSKAYPFVKDLTGHTLFDIAKGRHKVRDAHWTLATTFFKSIYSKDFFGRLEYKNLSEFLRSEKIKPNKAQKALDECRKILNFEKKVFDEAIGKKPEFEKYAGTARTLKWLFVCLATLRTSYALSGREHLVADGLLRYYELIGREDTDEWTAYVNTGRTGRIDTKEVRGCLAQLANQILLATGAEPIDPQRFFTKAQRDTIFQSSGSKCSECGIALTETNFHADHVKPHSRGGRTESGNGRALCSRCNRTKGNTWHDLFREVAPPAEESA